MRNDVRRKVGSVIVGSGKLLQRMKFPVYAHNDFRDGRSCITIQIYGDIDIYRNDAYWNSLEFTNRFNRGLDPIMYSICTTNGAREILGSMNRDGKAQIDLRALDKFFVEVDKMFVVRRLEQ